MTKVFLLSLTFFLSFLIGKAAEKTANYELFSPDKQLKIQISLGKMFVWNITHAGDTIMKPSQSAMELQSGTVWGQNVKVQSVKKLAINNEIKTPFYRKASVSDNCNQLTINCKGGYGIVFRAYNDGVAYRYFYTGKEKVFISDEIAQFNFNSEYKAWIPYIRDLRENDKYQLAFESVNDYIKLSEFKTDSFSLVPLLVDLPENKKALIMETDYQDYPGMFLNINTNKDGFTGVFARYPVKERVGGFNKLNYMVDARADYIAIAEKAKSFPWRIVFVSTQDKQLADNDMVQRLAEPCKIQDVSWIKPGKVAWDWWNNLNISKVDFRAGINTATYKYYIDFAAEYKVEYVVLDEGWYKGLNVMELSDQINLKEIIDYASSKNIGIILWASWHAFDTVKDQAFKKYSEMGIKGFKLDFFDRDDQKVMNSCYELAEMAANYKLIMDYHGMKPSGIQKTWPNVLNFEGVKGMENVKWGTDNVPPYDVTLPFTRMMAGPMDYTPGAMRNANKENFRPIFSMPMSQGTRCHQLAMYVVFEAPLQMMADNPTAYMRESESAKFIAKTPTIFDQTIVLDAKVGEYIVIARKKVDNWYIGAMTDWSNRELTIDLSFLAEGEYNAEIFADGINADRDATDYVRNEQVLTKNNKLKIKLAPGGGWAARLENKN